MLVSSTYKVVIIIPLQPSPICMLARLLCDYQSAESQSGVWASHALHHILFVPNCTRMSRSHVCFLLCSFLVYAKMTFLPLPRLEIFELHFAAPPVEYLVCDAVPHHLLNRRGEAVFPLLGGVVRLPTSGWWRVRADVSHVPFPTRMIYIVEIPVTVCINFYIQTTMSLIRRLQRLHCLCSAHGRWKEGLWRSRCASSEIGNNGYLMKERCTHSLSVMEDIYARIKVQQAVYIIHKA